MTVLRQGLLDGRAVAAAGGVPSAVVGRLGGLGARVEQLDIGLDEDRAREWATGSSPLHALVFDAGPTFGDGGQAELREPGANIVGGVGQVRSDRGGRRAGRPDQ